MHRKNLFSRIVFFKDAGIRAFIWTGILTSPWLVKVGMDLPKLKQSWYYPVDLQAIKSSLGNIFIGYEGTPDGLWRYTAWLTFFMLLIALHAISDVKHRARNGFFFLLTLLPMAIVLSISLFKPLLVNRYMMPVTISEILLIVFSLELVRNTWLQKALAGIFLTAIIAFNLWYPNKHAKQDIRSTIYEVSALAKENDVILAQSPLILFETLYYTKGASNVFWYNPDNIGFPWYVGDVAFSPSLNLRELPAYPARSFIIHEDTSYEVIYNTPMSVPLPLTKTKNP
jgi:hypothetical protein